MKNTSMFELLVLNRLKQANLPLPVREYIFHPARKWRFDFAWPDKKLAVECEGAVWSRGRHTRGKGFIADCEKYNAAALLGWRVLRYTTNQIDQVVVDVMPIIRGEK